MYGYPDKWLLFLLLLHAMCLYWFYNDTSEENNTLNGHCNELWIMNRGSSYKIK